jgi:hypothetical protein
MVYQTIFPYPQGKKIQVTVLKKWFLKYERFTFEQECFFINSPTVGTNFSRYHVVDNNDKLNLSYKTTVVHCHDFGGSIFGFDFTSLDLLANNRIPSGKIICQ